MARVLIAPPPNYEDYNADAWNDWLLRLRNGVNLASNVSWGDIDFTDSNLTSIVTRNHSALENVQGGSSTQQYHFTAAQHDNLVLIPALSNGIVVKTSSTAYSNRTITGTANEITVTNGDGVSGNPTIDLPEIIATPRKFGDSTNNTTFMADGTMVANGAATCFRDELNDLTKSAANNPSSHLVFDFTEGTLVFKTTADINDYAIMNVQINHDWKLGSNVYPHIHWFQAQNNTPNWLLQYRWQRNGHAKTTTWTNVKMNANAFTYSSGTLNQISGFPVINPPTDYGLSDVLQLRFMRDSTNASGLFSGADPYTVDVGATNADVHIEVDMLGSQGEYVK